MTDARALPHVRYERPSPRGPGRLVRLRQWWGRHAIAQAAGVAAIVAVGAASMTTLADNMHRLGLTPGFGFLAHAANFEIGETVIAYVAGDTYLRAFAVGLVNTVRVAVVGCLSATLLGVVLGIARLSTNPLLSRTVQAGIEIVRNTPLLLQLFFWNALVRALPPPRQALEPVPGVLLTNRGIYVPAVALDGGVGRLVLAMAVAVVVVALVLRRRRRVASASTATGSFLAVAVVPLFAVGAFAGALPALDRPHLVGFNIRGGLSLTPEYVTLVIGLAVNAAAGIAETVRGAILAIPAGQWEAARALGLPPGRVMRLVVLPQALRIIVPVVTSTWLGLTKNSSLAVAIGYPDLVSILNTTANVTGQALEAILVMMAVYLGLGLATSAGMNAWNRRRMRREGGRS